MARGGEKYTKMKLNAGGCFNGGDVFFYFFLQKSLYTSIKKCVVKE